MALAHIVTGIAAGLAMASSGVCASGAPLPKWLIIFIVDMFRSCTGGACDIVLIYFSPHAKRQPLASGSV